MQRRRRSDWECHGVERGQRLPGSRCAVAHRIDILTSEGRRELQSQQRQQSPLSISFSDSWLFCWVSVWRLCCPSPRYLGWVVVRVSLRRPGWDEAEEDNLCIGPTVISASGCLGVGPWALCLGVGPWALCLGVGPWARFRWVSRSATAPQLGIQLQCRGLLHRRIERAAAALCATNAQAGRWRAWRRANGPCHKLYAHVVASLRLACCIICSELLWFDVLMGWAWLLCCSVWQRSLVCFSLQPVSSCRHGSCIWCCPVSRHMIIYDLGEKKTTIDGESGGFSCLTPSQPGLASANAQPMAMWSREV